MAVNQVSLFLPGWALYALTLLYCYFGFLGLILSKYIKPDLLRIVGAVLFIIIGLLMFFDINLK